MALVEQLACPSCGGHMQFAELCEDASLTARRCTECMSIFASMAEIARLAAATPRYQVDRAGLWERLRELLGL